MQQARRGVKLANNIPSSLPTIRGDNGRIIQILHNLVGNSCKFTHSGSICVSAVHKGDEVEVSVSDSGIGIPDDKFESIFQAFEQVDMSTTRKYGGTGLGLNLVKQLVEAHDGRISVRSKLGAGTTFFFTLKVGVCVASDVCCLASVKVFFPTGEQPGSSTPFVIASSCVEDAEWVVRESCFHRLATRLLTSR
jgi:signal transduction histidine kinase